MHAILIAKDSDEAAVLALILKRAGVTVTTSGDLEQVLRQWPEQPGDLIVCALSDSNPQVLVRRIRAQAVASLIMVVNACDEDVQYNLFEAGADLVIARPYSARLLIARTRALLRRIEGVSLPSLPTVSMGTLVLDPATRVVELSGQPARRLTHLEFRLLYTLMLHRGQVLPTDTIVEHVWGYDNQGDRELVRGLISRLRAKVEVNPKKPHYIVTIPGVGYSFRPGEE